MRIGFSVIGVLAVMGCAEISGLDDLDFDAAHVQFCHALWKDGQPVEMTAVLGEGDLKTVFKARTECCTSCAAVHAGNETRVVLLEGDKEVYRTVTTFKKRNDYVLLATVFEGATEPSLGLSDLTRDLAECATHLPAGWGRCGSAKTAIIPEFDVILDSSSEAGQDVGAVVAQPKISPGDGSALKPL